MSSWTRERLVAHAVLAVLVGYRGALFLIGAGSKDVRPCMRPRAVRKSGLWPPFVAFRLRFREMTGWRQVQVCRRLVLR
jgi:hypothetical protein